MCSVASINYFGEIKGSGFLIGDGLLLTCNHVLALVELKDATATFPSRDQGHHPITLGFEEQPVLTSSTVGTITSKLSKRALRYDFALLKLKDWSKLAAAGIDPLEISKQNLLNAVVEVVGYPETFSSLIVHDGTMLLPYQLPRKDFKNVLAQRIIHYLNANSGLCPPIKPFTTPN